MTPGMFNLQSDLVMPYIAHYGTDEQVEKYMKPMRDGKTIGCLAMTEPSGGSDLQVLFNFLLPCWRMVTEKTLGRKMDLRATVSLIRMHNFSLFSSISFLSLVEKKILLAQSRSKIQKKVI